MKTEEMGDTIQPSYPGENTRKILKKINFLNQRKWSGARKNGEGQLLNACR